MNKKLIKMIFSICLLTSAYNANSMMLSPTSVTIPFFAKSIKTLARFLLKKYRLMGCKYEFERIQRIIKYDYTEEINKHDINKPDENGKTPLYWACYFGNFDLVKSFLNNGATKSINIADNDNCTPFYWACYFCCDNLDLVKLLLDKGARKSINIVNNDDDTPLYCVYHKYNLDLVKLLLQNGANVDQKHIDRAQNKPEILKYLTLVNDYDHVSKPNKVQFILGYEKDKDAYKMLVKRALVKDRISISDAKNMFNNLKEQLGSKEEKYKKSEDCRVITES